MSWWDSEAWHKYEVASGQPAGTRARLLAEAAWGTRVIDLTQDEVALWRGVRKSYHALINRLTKDSEFSIEPCHPGDVIGACHELHYKEAGRETRPWATWWMQRQWMPDHAVALVAWRGPMKPVGFAYAVVNGSWAYYFSAAAAEPNVGHALQWRLMQELKARGVARYEIGWQGEAKDQKGLAIEFFRRGFGGVDVPVSEVVAA